MVDLEELSEIVDFVKERDPAVVGGVVGCHVSGGVVSLELVWLVNVLLLL